MRAGRSIRRAGLLPSFSRSHVNRGWCGRAWTNYNMRRVCFMGKRSRSGLQPLPTATREDQLEAQRLMVLLESAAKTTTYDQSPHLWDELLTVLNLDICYQLTIAEVLRRGTWRKAANPRAY